MTRWTDEPKRPSSADMLAEIDASAARLAERNDVDEGNVWPDEAICANCGELIRLAFERDGQQIWDHPGNGHHTVCDWTEDMEPTSRVATPTKAPAEPMHKARRRWAETSRRYGMDPWLFR